MIKGHVTEHDNHQTLTIELPPSVRIEGPEVLFDSDSQSGKLMLTQLSEHKKVDWQAVFKAFDEADIPEDFLQDRDMSPPQQRPDWQCATCLTRTPSAILPGLVRQLHVQGLTVAGEVRLVCLSSHLLKRCMAWQGGRKRIVSGTR